MYPGAVSGGYGNKRGPFVLWGTLVFTIYARAIGFVMLTAKGEGRHSVVISPLEKKATLNLKTDGCSKIQLHPSRKRKDPLWSRAGAIPLSMVVAFA